MKSLDQVMQEIKKVLKDNNCDLRAIYYEETEQADMYIVQKSDLGPAYLPLDC